MEHICDNLQDKYQGKDKIKIKDIPYGGWYMYKEDISNVKRKVWINYCPFCGEKLMKDD